MGSLLRYPYEVRDDADYFDDVPAAHVTKDMLELARHIVKTKTGHFEPKKFEDHYEDALRELIKKKQKGEEITPPKEHAPAKVINLMDALRRSVEGEGRRPPASSHKTRRSTTKRTGHSTRRKKAS